MKSKDYYEEKQEYNLNPFYKYKGVVNRVVDADTVDATIDIGFGVFTKQRLRIDDFDAPETWRPRNEAEKEHGIAATMRAKELLEGKDLIFTTSKAIGIYGRYGASITFMDGSLFRDIMISEGFEKKDEYVQYKNKIQCAICKDIIESTFRHDFVRCKCGAIFVDGGHDYWRRGGERENIIEIFEEREKDK